jgi:hypothetical protein
MADEFKQADKAQQTAQGGARLGAAGPARCGAASCRRGHLVGNRRQGQARMAQGQLTKVRRQALVRRARSGDPVSSASTAAAWKSTMSPFNGVVPIVRGLQNPRQAVQQGVFVELVQAGVRVFFYLEDRERTLDSPTDKIMLSLTAFADELEREKARQRTYDAMQRKARARHVTGGPVFGYTNVEILGPDGRVRTSSARSTRRMRPSSARSSPLRSGRRQDRDRQGAERRRCRRATAPAGTPPSVGALLGT